jgi:hypothetical protein
MRNGISLSSGFLAGVNIEPSVFVQNFLIGQGIKIP